MTKSGLTLALFMAVAPASVVQAAAIDQTRLTPVEITAKEAGGAGVGTSGVAGIRTTVLLGDQRNQGSTLSASAFQPTPQSRRTHIAITAQPS